LIGDRPAVKRGCEVLADLRKPLQNDKKAMETLFGKGQYAKR
jgi:GST-like protein